MTDLDENVKSLHPDVILSLTRILDYAQHACGGITGQMSLLCTEVLPDLSSRDFTSPPLEKCTVRVQLVNNKIEFADMATMKEVGRLSLVMITRLTAQSLVNAPGLLLYIELTGPTRERGG